MQRVCTILVVIAIADMIDSGPGTSPALRRHKPAPGHNLPSRERIAECACRLTLKSGPEMAFDERDLFANARIGMSGERRQTPRAAFDIAERLPEIMDQVGESGFG